MQQKLKITAIILILLVGAEIFFLHGTHATEWWHKIPGFQGILGLACGMGLLLGAKALAKSWLARKEEYYD